MAEKAKQPVRSPEEETFHRYYNKLLSGIYFIETTARLLFADGIISSETKETITSNIGVEGKRTLLGAIQHALENAPDPEKTFQSLLVALSGGMFMFSTVCDEMKNFNRGECTISLETNS